jgi:hypothetical protein
VLYYPHFTHSNGRALQHIESQYPPDKKYCNNCRRNMDDPVATCFRSAEIEHDGIVARSSDRAPMDSWREIPITLVDLTGVLSGCPATLRRYNERVQMGRAVIVVIASAAMFAQSVPPACPAGRPVDDIIAEMHKEQSKRKNRNGNPFPTIHCVWAGASTLRRRRQLFQNPCREPGQRTTRTQIPV